jgi:hypothetical protein
MLKWLRSRASTVAAAALVSLVAMGLAELRPHVPDCHDRDCAEGFIAPSDAKGSRFTGASPDASDAHDGLHCAGCHLSRSFRTRPQAAAFHAPPTDRSSRPHLVEFQLRPGPSLAEPSLRAPPSPIHA